MNEKGGKNGKRIKLCSLISDKFKISSFHKRISFLQAYETRVWSFYMTNTLFLWGMQAYTPIPISLRYYETLEHETLELSIQKNNVQIT